MGWKFQKIEVAAIIFITFLFLLLSGGCLKEGTDSENPDGAEIKINHSSPEADFPKRQLSTVVAVYMVGSDLESSN